jgi:hypothetical protein
MTVTVQDRGAPVVNAPANIVAEATVPDGAMATWDPMSATDDVDGTLPATCAPASAATFALAETTVSCTATDNAGDFGTDSFTVTVADTTAPIVHAVDDIIAEATSSTGAAVTFASDDAGNTSGTTFHVTVRDTTPPTLTVADDQVAEATSPHGAAVIGELSAARQRTTDGEVEAFLAPSEARS